jgi:hypothetical protein
MMYTKADYLKHFANTDSDTLLDRLAHNELTEDARQAMREILTERGCAIPHLAMVDISDDVVLTQAMAIWRGACPHCRKSGSAVDMRTEHWVWSAIFLTRFGRRTALSCRDCGKRRNLQALGKCILLGWWGVPFGLLITPYKIFANVGEMLRKDREEPSDALRDVVRARLAATVRPRL